MITIVSSERAHTRYSNERFAQEADFLGDKVSFLNPETLVADGLMNLDISNITHLLVRTGTSTITPEVLELMRRLEQRQVTVINSLKTYELAGDKWRAYNTAIKSTISTPRTKYLGFKPEQTKVEEIVKQFDFPIVLKGISGARGEQVFLCDSFDSVTTIILYNPQIEFIIQEYIPTSYGSDLRVYVVDSVPVAAIRRTSANGFKANISQGGTAEAFEIDAPLKELVEKVIQVFSFQVGGIDLLFGELAGEYYLTELNLAAQFQAIEETTKVNIAKLILQMMLKK